jgi:ABC-type nitrate/sulfonate/bicarbonate transport system substrate-binding protein
MSGNLLARRLLLPLALLVTGAWLAACAPAAAPPAAPPRAGAPAAAASPTGPAQAAAAVATPAPTKVNMVFSSRSANTTPLFVAYEQGYLAQEGLDVDLAFISSTTAGQALIANSVQLGLIGAEGIDMNLEAGSPITKYVAAVTPKLVFNLVGHPDLTGVQDLRGKIVAATRQGSVSDYAARKVLQQHGLQPDTDVAFTYPGTSEASLAALLAGHIHAMPAGIPADLTAVEQGMKVLVEIERQNIPFLMAGVIVRTDYAAANPDVIERYLRAHLQGVATTLRDPETAMTAMGKYLQNEDRRLLRYAYDVYRPSWSRDQLMPEDTIAATLAESRKPGARTAALTDFYDNSFLERIKASGYVDRLYADPPR